MAVFARLEARAAAEREGVLAALVLRAAVVLVGAFVAPLDAGFVLVAVDFAALEFAPLAVTALALAVLAPAVLAPAVLACAALAVLVLVALVVAVVLLAALALVGLLTVLVAEAPALRLLRDVFALVPLEGVLSPVCAIARSFPHYPSYQGGDCRQSGLFPCALNASFTMLHQPVL
ncbi:MAG: hypothetical protein ACE360_03395 [Hyphomicrobiales bacterium]